MKRLEDLDCGAFGYHQLMCVYNEHDRLIGVYYPGDRLEDENLINELSVSDVEDLEKEMTLQRMAR